MFFKRLNVTYGKEISSKYDDLVEVGLLWFHHCHYVSMSVGKRIFSKTAHRILMKLLIKLECLKFEKLTEPDFWEKISFWR